MIYPICTPYLVGLARSQPSRASAIAIMSNQGVAGIPQKWPEIDGNMEKNEKMGTPMVSQVIGMTWGCLNFSDNPAAVLKRPWIGAAVACWNPPRSREAG